MSRTDPPRDGDGPPPYEWGDTVSMGANARVTAAVTRAPVSTRVTRPTRVTRVTSTRESTTPSAQQDGRTPPGSGPAPCPGPTRGGPREPSTPTTPSFLGLKMDPPPPCGERWGVLKLAEGQGGEAGVDLIRFLENIFLPPPYCQ